MAGCLRSAVLLALRSNRIEIIGRLPGLFEKLLMILCQGRPNDRSRLRFLTDAGGKSELQRAGCSVTRSRGNAKESATEKIPPYEIGVTAIS
jgi:hypothetical protein